MYHRTYSVSLHISAAFLLLLTATSVAKTLSPVVVTTQGNFQGINACKGVEAFLGIPYADSPTGPLRFQPPRPINTAKPYRQDPNGTVFATEFGPVCYQLHYDNPMLPQNLRESNLPAENCLTLNIWRPSNITESKPTPVMIWVHGGAFSEGGASVPSK
jgi:para-nitrobenzyl esterase